MKILFVITKSEIGGAQKWVKEQIDILETYGHQCFLCTNQEGWLTQNLKSTNYLIDKRIEKRVSIAFTIKLRNFIKTNNISLIIGNSANGGIYSRLSAYKTGGKCIYVSHGWSSVYNGGKLTFVFNWIEKILSVITSKVLCVSSNDYQIAFQKIGINKKKLVVIPNKILPIQSAISEINKHEKKSKRILFLGRLASPKNPIPLINAIANNSQYTLDIVGTGPNLNTINDFIQVNNIKNVNLLGEIKNFNSFKRYDIFSLISESEGLPISAVEALSAGLPILISNVGGCPEVINDNGYLTDNTPSDILKGLQIISDNYILFSQNSNKLFREKFDLSTNYMEYINLYENV